MTFVTVPGLKGKYLSRRNPAGAPKKSRVKTVFPASNAVTTAAGYAAASGSALATRDPFKIFPESEDEGMALTWVIKSLTEPTECSENYQKKSVISRRGVDPMGRRLRALRE